MVDPRWRAHNATSYVPRGRPVDFQLKVAVALYVRTNFHAPPAGLTQNSYSGDEQPVAPAVKAIVVPAVKLPGAGVSVAAVQPVRVYVPPAATSNVETRDPCCLAQTAISYLPGGSVVVVQLKAGFEL